MTNYEKIYWLTRLDELKGLSAALVCISILAIICIFAYINMLDEMSYYSIEHKHKNKALIAGAKSKIKWAVILLIIGSLGLTFIPTTKDAVMIIAGGKTLDFIKSDTSTQNIPSLTTNMVESFLEKQINSLNEKTQ